RTDHAFDIRIGRVLSRADIDCAEHTKADERQHIAAPADPMGSTHERHVAAAKVCRANGPAKARNGAAISGRDRPPISRTHDADARSWHHGTAIARADAANRSSRSSVDARRP